MRHFCMVTEKRELPCVDCVKANYRIYYTAKYHWSYNSSWQFSKESAQEIGAHRVHIASNFSQEYRSLMWEH